MFILVLGGASASSHKEIVLSMMTTDVTPREPQMYRRALWSLLQEHSYEKAHYFLNTGLTPSYVHAQAGRADLPSRPSDDGHS